MRRPRGRHGIHHTNQSVRFCRCSCCVRRCRDWQYEYGKALWNPRDPTLQPLPDQEDVEPEDEETDVVDKWLQKYTIEELAARFADEHNSPRGPNQSQGRCVNYAPLWARKKSVKRGQGARGGRKSQFGHKKLFLLESQDFDVEETFAVEDEKALWMDLAVFIESDRRTMGNFMAPISFRRKDYIDGCSSDCHMIASELCSLSPAEASSRLEPLQSSDRDRVWQIFESVLSNRLVYKSL